MAGQMQMQMGLEDLRSPTAIRAAVGELIGTGFFVFAGVGSIAAFVVTAGTGGIPLIAFAHGLAIALLVAGLAPISGGYVNPAVTFAAVITNRITVTRGAMYVAAQLVGAVLGALLLKAFVNDSVLSQIPGAGGHALDKNAVTSQLAGMGIEAVLTGLLVWTVFATAFYPKGNAVIAPLAIGFAILVIHLVAIPLTGSGVNPARTFGPAIAGIGGGGDTTIWGDWWIYYVGPLLGGGVAGLVYYFLYLWQDERAAAGAPPGA